MASYEEREVKVKETALPVTFLRADLSRSGSHKDYLIDGILPELNSLPEKTIAVSSSGNLAISLAQAVSTGALKREIIIFTASNLPATKSSALHKLAITSGGKVILKESKQPRKDSLNYSQQNDSVYLLRPSAHPEWSRYYHALGKEIAVTKEQIPETDVVIICCSSGLSTIGICDYLIEQKFDLPVCIVQTSHINSIAKAYDADFNYEESTLANAVADKIAALKNQVLEKVSQTKGNGVVVDNSLIDLAAAEINNQRLIANPMHEEFTANTALSLAGLYKLYEKGYNFAKPLLVISGN